MIRCCASHGITGLIFWTDVKHGGLTSSLNSYLALLWILDFHPEINYPQQLILSSRSFQTFLIDLSQSCDGLVTFPLYVPLSSVKSAHVLHLAPARCFSVSNCTAVAQRHICESDSFLPYLAFCLFYFFWYFSTNSVPLCLKCAQAAQA